MMTVFYADDDSEDREVFCDIIQQINPAIKVMLASNGLQALEMLQKADALPHFIFLDINMPVMNGRECLIKLKSIDRLKRIPVIIYTTSSVKEELKELVQLGAQDFIIKANSFNKAKESIHQVLSKAYSSIL